MKAGRLGIVTEGALEDIGAAEGLNKEEAHIDGEEKEMVRGISLDESVQATLSTVGEVEAIEGSAIYDEVGETTQATVNGNNIRPQTEVTVRRRTATDFVAVPATDEHPGFVLATNSNAPFVFDLLAANQTMCEITPATIELNPFVDKRLDHATFGEIMTEDGYGLTKARWNSEEVDKDHITSSLNEYRVNTVDYISGEEYRRMYLARSGWIEAYKPEEMETTDFVEFVANEVLPHAQAGE
jgi:hypothetical protein